MKELIHQVMVLEDDLAQVAFLKELWAAHESLAGIEMVAVGTLAEAGNLCGSQVFGLVLLDLSLPDGRGMETFVRVAELMPDAAIVVLSGKHEEPLAIETVHFGAADYLLKGEIDGGLLFRTVKYGLERKRLQLQLKRAYADLDERVRERTASLQEVNRSLQNEIAERKRSEEETLKSNRQLAAAVAQIRESQDKAEESTKEESGAGGGMLETAILELRRIFEIQLATCEAWRAEGREGGEHMDTMELGAIGGLALLEKLRIPGGAEGAGAFSGDTVSLNDLVEAGIEASQERRQKRARAVGCDIDVLLDLAEIPPIVGDGPKLQQAVEGVLAHALQAIPRRGTVSIRTELKGQAVYLTIADDGIGLAPEVRQRCLQGDFQPESEAGPGFGFNRCAAIVGEHAGQFLLESDPERGTTVTFVFPLAQEKPVLVEAVPVGSKGLRILVVDDEPLVREVIGVYLSEDDHQVTTACNGLEGLRTFQSESFDLVLTDRAMPEMDGTRLAAEIKKLKPGQPVILLTGFGESAGENPPGVDIVVSKPFTMKTLRTAIDAGLNRFPSALS